MTGDHIYYAKIIQVLEQIISMLSNSASPSHADCVFDLEKIMTPLTDEEIRRREQTKLLQKKAAWARWLSVGRKKQRKSE